MFSYISGASNTAGDPPSLPTASVVVTPEAPEPAASEALVRKAAQLELQRSWHEYKDAIEASSKAEREVPHAITGVYLPLPDGSPGVFPLLHGGVRPYRGDQGNMMTQDDHRKHREATPVLVIGVWTVSGSPSVVYVLLAALTSANHVVVPFMALYNLATIALEITVQNTLSALDLYTQMTNGTFLFVNEDGEPALNYEIEYNAAMTKGNIRGHLEFRFGSGSSRRPKRIIAPVEPAPVPVPPVAPVRSPRPLLALPSSAPDFGGSGGGGAVSTVGASVGVTPLSRRVVSEQPAPDVVHADEYLAAPLPRTAHLRWLPLLHLDAAHVAFLGRRRASSMDDPDSERTTYLHWTQLMGAIPRTGIMARLDANILTWGSMDILNHMADGDMDDLGRMQPQLLAIADLCDSTVVPRGLALGGMQLATTFSEIVNLIKHHVHEFMEQHPQFSETEPYASWGLPSDDWSAAHGLSGVRR